MQKFALKVINKRAKFVNNFSSSELFVIENERIIDFFRSLHFMTIWKDFCKFEFPPYFRSR